MKESLPSHEIVLPEYHNASVIEFNGEIIHEAAIHFKNALQELTDEDPQKPILISIDSQGGDLQSSIDIAKKMHHISNPITTVAESQVMSGALVLLVLGDKGKRFAHEDTEFMIHQTLVSAQFKQTSLPEVVGTVKHAMRQQREYFRELSIGTGLSVTEILKLAEHTRFFNAIQAKEFGFIDHIIPRQRRLDERRGKAK